MNTTATAHAPFPAEHLVPATVDDAADHGRIANYFRDVIDLGVLFALGATDLRAVPGPDQMGGLLFDARILPFVTDGTRGESARVMSVMVSLTTADAIDVDVRHRARGTEHATAHGIYIDQLNKCLLALDYDGRTAFNPRYFPN